MRITRRIVNLLRAPEAEWTTIALEPVSVDGLIRRYIVPLAFPAPIATMIGATHFDRTWDPTAGYLVPRDEIYAAGATTFFSIILSVFILAAIFKVIAPMYGSSRDYVAALNVATFGAVPVLLAGATLLIPAMAIVTMVALCYTLYLYWLGVGEVLAVPEGARAEFVGISMTLLICFSTLGGAFASRLGLF